MSRHFKQDEDGKLVEFDPRKPKGLVIESFGYKLSDPYIDALKREWNLRFNSKMPAGEIHMHGANGTGAKVTGIGGVNECLP